MGKKRKADGRGSYSGASKEPSMSDSKLRVNTFEDVANSEDEFHINQDKVFLEEGPAQKRRRKAREDGEICGVFNSRIAFLNVNQMSFLSSQKRKSSLLHPALATLKILKKTTSSKLKALGRESSLPKSPSLPLSNPTQELPRHNQTMMISAAGELRRRITTMPISSKLKLMPSRKRLKPEDYSRNSYRE